MEKVPPYEAPSSSPEPLKPNIQVSQPFSIKNSLSEFKETPVIPDSQLPRTPLNSDALRKASRNYALYMKEAGKETFFHAVVKRDFTFNDESITWWVDNEVQVVYITPMLMEFMTYMKKELNNGFLQIQLQLTEEETTEKKPYTGKEKYQALARKNPNLHTLKNRFNLDIEF